MFASIISGALISLVAVLSRAAAPDGGGDRLGSALRLRSAASPPRSASACHLRHALLHRLCGRRRPARLVARPSRAARRPTASRQPPAMARHPPSPTSNGIRSAVSCSGSRAFAGADHLCRAAHARHRRRDHHGHAAARRDAHLQSAERTAAPPRWRNGSMRWWRSRRLAAASVAMPTLTLNLWLAAKIAATSGRLHRPWPDLQTAALPPMTLVVLCVALAFCFTGGLLAILAQIVTSALMMAYALHRPCGAAYADAGAEEPRLLARLDLRHRRAVRLAGARHGGARRGRRRVRLPRALSAHRGRRRCRRPEVQPFKTHHHT